MNISDYQKTFANLTNELIQERVVLTNFASLNKTLYAIRKLDDKIKEAQNLKPDDFSNGERIYNEINDKIEDTISDCLDIAENQYPDILTKFPFLKKEEMDYYFNLYYDRENTSQPGPYNKYYVTKASKNKKSDSDFTYIAKRAFKKIELLHRAFDFSKEAKTYSISSKTEDELREFRSCYQRLKQELKQIMFSSDVEQLMRNIDTAIRENVEYDSLNNKLYEYEQDALVDVYDLAKLKDFVDECDRFISNAHYLNKTKVNNLAKEAKALYKKAVVYTDKAKQDELEAKRKAKGPNALMLWTFLGITLFIIGLTIVQCCIYFFGKLGGGGIVVGIFLGFLYGLARIVLCTSGIPYVWKLVMQNPLMPGDILTSIYLGFFLLFLIFHLLYDKGVPFFKNASKSFVSNLVLFVSIIIYLALLGGIGSYLVGYTGIYLNEIWKTHFIGFVVGFFFAIFRCFMLITGAGYWWPALYKGITVSSSTLNTYSFILFGAVIFYVIYSTVINKKWVDIATTSK